jgi:hypothetical protein
MGRAEAARDERRHPTRGWVLVPASVVMGLVCLDLLGWLLHVPLLTSFVPRYATMKPNTAVCLGMLAVAACLGPMSVLRPGAGQEAGQDAGRRAGRDASQGAGRGIAACLAGLSVLLSGGTLLECLTRSDLGLDGLVLQVPADRLSDAAGRMSPGTAVCLTLIGLATLVLDWAPGFSMGCVLSAAAIALSASVGFLFRAGPLFGVPWLSSMAVHTALCVLLLSTALLASRPEREPVASLVRQALDGAPRGLLLGVTVVPILVALPAVVAMRLGLVDASFAMAVVVVVLIGVQTWILWRDSRVLYRSQQRRKEVEGELARSEQYGVVGRLSASISHELANSLDTARNLLYLIEGAVSLSESKDFAAMAGEELANMHQITAQTSRFHEQAPEVRGG